MSSRPVTRPSHSAGSGSSRVVRTNAQGRKIKGTTPTAETRLVNMTPRNSPSAHVGGKRKVGSRVETNLPIRIETKPHTDPVRPMF